MLSITRKQAIVFALIYGSYVVCLIVKRNYSFWSQDLIRTEYIKKADAGLLGFWWETLNGIAKIGGGVLVDMLSPTVLLSTSLAIQGLTCLAFLSPGADRWYLSTGLWGLNGASQAFAWPALTRIFISWFPNPSQRGFLYGILATCQNVGAAVGPVVTASAAVYYGWTARLYLPGIIAVAYAIGCYFCLTDSPTSPSDIGQSSTALNETKSVATNSLTTTTTTTTTARGRSSSSGRTGNANSTAATTTNTRELRQRRSPESSPAVATAAAGGTTSVFPATTSLTVETSLTPSQTSTSSITTTTTTTGSSSSPSTTTTTTTILSFPNMLYLVLSSPTLWLLGVNYFFNSILRNGITTGLPAFVEGKEGLGFPPKSGAAEAANMGFEIGGALGALAAGWLSDKYCRGRRAPVMALFGFAAAPVVCLLAYAPPQWFFVDTTTYGTGDTSSSSSSSSFTSLFFFFSPFAFFPHLKLSCVYFLIGLCAFPPHVLNGLVSRELAHPSVLSSAGGFTKSIGQAGSAMADLYILRAADALGWTGTIRTLAACAVLSGVTILPLWNSIGSNSGSGIGSGSGSGVSSISHDSKSEQVDEGVKKKKSKAPLQRATK